MSFRFYPGAKTINKNTNSNQNKSETHHAKQYEVTSFLSTDCELSTETCSKNVYSLGSRSLLGMSSFLFFRLPPSAVATADLPSPFVPIFCILLRHFNLSHVLSRRIHEPPFSSILSQYRFSLTLTASPSFLRTCQNHLRLASRVFSLYGIADLYAVSLTSTAYFYHATLLYTSSNQIFHHASARYLHY